jgi:CheY-like chemotaxis protein
MGSVLVARPVMRKVRAMVRLTVVNDNPELLNLIGEILEGDRYVTTLIGNVQADLLQQICRSEPDLLMIDLRDGDDARRGWEMVKELRRTSGCQDLPVVVCSADIAGLKDVAPELEAAADFLAVELPFRIDELLQSIHRLLGRRAALKCG